MLQMGKLRPRFSHLTKLVHHRANVETGSEGSKLTPRPLFGSAAFFTTFLFKNHHKYLPRGGCFVEQMAVVVMMLWLLSQTEGPRNLSTEMLDPGESSHKMG